MSSQRSNSEAANDVGTKKNKPEPPLDLYDVRNKELEEIEKRRNRLGLRPIEHPLPTDPLHQLMGLALSGGGMRSACFNLGFMQALEKYRLLRYVDYIASVSGGGYIAAHIHADALPTESNSDDHVEKEAIQPLLDSATSDTGKSETAEMTRPCNATAAPAEDRDDADDPVSSDIFSSLAEVNPGHKQPRPIQKFVHNGSFLKKPGRLFNEYLIGVIMINFAVMTAAISVCAGIAYIWRCFDLPVVRDRLKILDWDHDLYAPFFPFFIFAVLWLLAWLASYLRHDTDAQGHRARILLAIMTGSLLVGYVVLTGNGDISLGVFNRGAGPASIETRHWAPLVSLIALGLLPLISPKRLLKSGLNPSNVMEKIVFRIASTALLIGLPLIIIGFLARENISGYMTDPNRALHPAEIKDWAGLRHYYESYRPYATAISAKEEADIHTVFSNIITRMQDKRAILEKQRNSPANANLFQLYAEKFQQIGSFLNWMVRGSNARGYDDYWSMLSEEREFKQQLCSKLNRYILSTTNLSEFLLGELYQLSLSDSQKSSGPNGNSQIGSQGGGKHRPPTIDKKKLRNWLKDSKNMDSASLRKALIGYTYLSPAEIENRSENEIRSFNWKLLVHLFPDVFRDRENTQRRVVIYKDQSWRLVIMLGAAGLFLLIGLPVDLNGTTLHTYYRNQLAHAFISDSDQKRRQGGLADYDTAGQGMPYHLICATVSLFRKKIGIEKEHAGLCPVTREKTDDAGHPGSVDPRWSDTFVFSYRICGSSLTGYRTTSDYDKAFNQIRRSNHNYLTVADAIALSGAAICPSQRQGWFLAFLMVTFNLRLGQWLPNPQRDPHHYTRRQILTKKIAGASVLGLIWQLFRKAEDRAHCFVSDGGHHENLGLVELLKRRCQFIIVSDAGYDPNHYFADLAHAIRKARMFGGVELISMHPEEGCDFTRRLDLRGPEGETPVPLAANEKDPEAIRLHGRNLVKEHFVAARIRYHDDPLDPRQNDGVDQTHPHIREGLLIFVKPSMTGDESPDLKQYRNANPAFPHQSTSDQFFDPAQVESYRYLGWHIGEKLCLKILANADLDQIHSANHLYFHCIEQLQGESIQATSTSDSIG